MTSCSSCSGHDSGAGAEQRARETQPGSEAEQEVEAVLAILLGQAGEEHAVGIPLHRVSSLNPIAHDSSDNELIRTIQCFVLSIMFGFQPTLCFFGFWDINKLEVFTTGGIYHCVVLSIIAARHGRPDAAELLRIANCNFVYFSLFIADANSKFFIPIICFLETLQNFLIFIFYHNAKFITRVMQRLVVSASAAELIPAQ